VQVLQHGEMNRTFQNDTDLTKTRRPILKPASGLVLTLTTTVRHIQGVRMIYILLGILVLIVITTFSAVNKLGQITYLMNLLNDKITDLHKDTKKANKLVSNINSKIKSPIRTNIKAINIDNTPNNYMIKMYGFIEQTKMFSISQIFSKMETLPYKDNNDYIKKYYLSMFAWMMEENDLGLDDFKLHSTYGGAGPSEYFYVKFKLKDAKYHGWDEWISKATLVTEMKNGEIKEFEVKSGVNNLDEYFENENENESVHFFDALAKTYNSFSFDNESYRSIGGYADKDYIIVLNDLIHNYNRVGKEWNVVFADAMSVGFDLEWTGKLEDVFVKTEIINKSWAIDSTQTVQVLAPEILKEKRQNIFEELQQNSEDNNQFKLATMLYYEQFKTDWKDEEGLYQKQAISIWKKLAEKKHAYSQLVLGIIFHDGLYLLKDYSKSKKYIQQAFENGLEKPAHKVWEELKLYEY